MLRVWLTLLALGAASQAAAAGWNPKLAASYLDERQKLWFEWPRAAKPGGPCMSCHTGLTYLIARPALRRVLGESAPTKWETGLLDAMRERLDGKAATVTPAPSAASAGVESIFAALFLKSPAALERMASLQLREGNAKGGWNWFLLEQDPWENTEAQYFGAALAALALEKAPAADGEREALTEYLKAGAPEQPLQNRLTLLWTAKGLPGVAKREWVDEAFAKQEKDGGWTVAALGPWKARENAPAVTGSDGYATAFVAYVLLEAGVPAGNPRLARALDWLRAHQDKAGYWDSVSMNRRYEPGSIPEHFMRDAATGFAAAALVKAESGAR